MLGDVANQQLCDLACGQGRIARLLAQRAAHVTGIDISSELITIARRDEDNDPLGITYIVDDAQTLSRVADATFDGVVCNLALMDIPDLRAVVRSVWRILRPDGWFLCSITHPCFESPHAQWNTAADGTLSREVFSYFAEGFWRSTNPHGVRGKVGAYHRTLATYITAIAQTGFIITELIEPQPQTPDQASIPGYRIVPAFLCIRCQKREQAG